MSLPFEENTFLESQVGTAIIKKDYIIGLIFIRCFKRRAMTAMYVRMMGVTHSE